jgi:hypothetical protein
MGMETEGNTMSMQVNTYPEIVFYAYARMVLGVRFVSSYLDDGSCSGYELLSNKKQPGYMSTTLQGLSTHMKCKYLLHPWLIQRDKVTLCTLLISVAPLVGSMKRTYNLARYIDNLNDGEGIKYLEMTKPRDYADHRTVKSVSSQLKCESTEQLLDHILNP